MTVRYRRITKADKPWHPVRCSDCGRAFGKDWSHDVSLAGTTIHGCPRCGRWMFPPTLAHVAGGKR